MFASNYCSNSHFLNSRMKAAVLPCSGRGKMLGRTHKTQRNIPDNQAYSEPENDLARL